MIAVQLMRFGNFELISEIVAISCYFWCTHTL